MAPLIRIQKYLSEINLCSRREAERWLAAGRIRINGEVVTEMGTMINPDKDHLSVDEAGKVTPTFRYICFNKPSGIVTNLPSKGEKEIKEFLPNQLTAVRPIGLLDKFSEGVIVLTDDRIYIKYALDAQHQREYVVYLRQEITNEMLTRLDAELIVPGSRVQRSDYEVIDEMQLVIRMNDGKGRQMSKLLSKIGIPVAELIRVKYGPVVLGKLAVGEHRNLSPYEIDSLRHPERSNFGGSRHSRFKRKKK